MQKDYSGHYNENSLQQKLKDFALKAGQQVVYAVLLLYYVMKNPGIPMKKKASIAAALGYFILPLDIVPDLVPLIGYSDDLGVLVFALLQVATSLTPEIRQQARNKMHEWFRKVDDKKLLALEGKIKAKK